MSQAGTGAGIIAIQCCFIGSVSDYQQQFAVWVVTVRPEICVHCGKVVVHIFWGSYERWVYTLDERVRVTIQRVRCIACGVTDALLPSFLHMYRRYTMTLIQEAILLALEAGLWSDRLINRVAPLASPVVSTVLRWVWVFVLSAEAWLVVWIEHTLFDLDPLTKLDLSRPPDHLLNIPNDKRRQAFVQGWQAIRLAEMLYAATRTRQPDLVFQVDTLFAFLATALSAARCPPRILWPQGAARAPT